MTKNNEVLPGNLHGLLQEHSAGGFLLVKIDGDGVVQNILEYDDERSYQAIMRKATLFIEAMNKVDQQMILANLFGQDEEGFEDDEEETGGEEDTLQ